MKLDLKFEENAKRLDLEFGQYQDLTDGGYERGYAEGEAVGREAGYIDGYTEGETAGHAAGYAEGLAARTYETWTITLADGSIVEKDVALL